MILPCKKCSSIKKLNFKPDIIHSVYWNSGHLAWKLSEMWGIPYVHSVISNGRGRNAHGAKGTAPKRIETEEKVFKNASFILCVAESEKTSSVSFMASSRKNSCCRAVRSSSIYLCITQFVWFSQKIRDPL